jgi:hypothetical protein
LPFAPPSKSDIYYTFLPVRFKAEEAIRQAHFDMLSAGRASGIGLKKPFSYDSILKLTRKTSQKQKKWLVSLFEVNTPKSSLLG